MVSHKSICIFTTFQEFNPGYSLTGIVADQALMLLRHGHKVIVAVNEQYNPKFEDDCGITKIKRDYPDKFVIEKCVKFLHLDDYQTRETLKQEHKQGAAEAALLMQQVIERHDVGIIYTHDFVYTGWNLPYAEAIKKASAWFFKSRREVYWFHWIHSVPSANKDWWNLADYHDNHFLVFPNRTSIQAVAENFKCSPGRVMTVPHIKDIRTWYDFSDETMRFIDKYPNIMQADIVQVYPASTDRLSAKQVDIVIRIFASFKTTKVIRPFLVIANQWATGRQRKEDVKEYIKIGTDAGLVYGEDFVFTSEYSEIPDDMLTTIKKASTVGMLQHYASQAGFEQSSRWYEMGKLEDKIAEVVQHFQPFALGISKKMLRELQLLGNLFIFPTIEESFGLVGPEAAFSGCLNITNRSLIMQLEVMGHMAPAFDFGSHHMIHPPAKEDDYLKAVSGAILHRLLINESVQTKNHCRIRYNMEAIYQKYYAPHLLH